MKIDFIGSAYISRSKTIDYQECVNWYPEIEQGNSKNVIALIPTPGLISFVSDSTSGNTRGMYTTSTGKLYKVSGSSLYEISTLGIQSLVGALLTNTGMVSMADNGVTLVIADGKHLYTNTMSSNTFAQTTTFDDGSTPLPEGFSNVIFIAGLFVTQWPGQRGRFMWSNSYLATWNALNYATAEGSPDALLTIVKANNEIWLVGEQSTEVWYLTGDSNLPFARVSSSFVDIGTVAKQSVTTNGSVVFWLGSNAAGHGVVWMATGYQPARVSTHAIEYAISTIGRLDDAIAYCYQQEGHSFYVLSFQTYNRTFVYDLTTGMWHERGSWNANDGENKRHVGICHAFFNQKNYIGDYSNGNVYELSLNTFTDNGATIVRQRTSSHISKEHKRIFFNDIELEMERGVGLTAGQGNDPQMMLQWSDDGGFTWSNERWATIGAIGTYGTRVRWNRLGSSRDRIFRVSISDPVKAVLIDAYTSIEVE